MDKVLILGSEGMLGLSLVELLGQFDYELKTHSRGGSTDFKFDAKNYDSLVDSLSQYKPDVLINLVANTSVDACEENPVLAFEDNALSVKNIVKWIKSSSNKTHLIHISTDQVYDREGPHEEENILLSNYYAYSKFIGEVNARKINSTIIRTNFFGKSLSNKRASFSDWIIDSLRSSNEIKVFTNVLFSPLSINSLVKLIEEIIRKRKIGTFNLGSNEGMSKAEFAFNLADIFRLDHSLLTKIKDEEIQLKAYRPKDMRMNIKKFEREFSCTLPALIDEIKLIEGDYYD